MKNVIIDSVEALAIVLTPGYGQNRIRNRPLERLEPDVRKVESDLLTVYQVGLYTILIGGSTLAYLMQ